MKKAQLFVILLVVMLLLTLADYHFNTPGGLSLPPSTASDDQQNPGLTPVVKADPNLTQKTLDSDPQLSHYRIDKRTRSLELFETFDLKQMTNTVVYKNVLYDSADPNGFPLYIYEIHGTPGQGKTTYLNLKLALIEQSGSSEAFNETNQYGQSSLFYNDQLSTNSGYLLVQVKDNVFGFKYFKTSDQIFKDIQRFISVQNTLSTQ